MAKKELPEDEGPSQEWLASYADAMTLLLAFFIMMFAFALIDEGKYFDFKVGVMAALGVPDPLTDNTDSILSQGTGITPEIGFTPVNPTEEEEEQAEQVRQALAEAGVVTPRERRGPEGPPDPGLRRGRRLRVRGGRDRRAGGCSSASTVGSCSPVGRPSSTTTG